MSTEGGTVRYHHAEYRMGNVRPWRVWFTDGDSSSLFTAAEGEAMGLTPPEPVATITLPDGRSADVPVGVLEDLVESMGRLTHEGPGATAARALAPLFADSDRNPT